MLAIGSAVDSSVERGHILSITGVLYGVEGNHNLGIAAVLYQQKV